MPYNINNFLLPINSDNNKINIYNESKGTRTKVDPFYIKRLWVDRYYVRINLKNDTQINLDFSNLEDAKSALVLIREQYQILTSPKPELVDRKLENYVDGEFVEYNTSLDGRKSVVVVSNTNLTTIGTQSIDGYLVNVGDRVLLSNQTNPLQNGIYLVSASSWERDYDSDGYIASLGNNTYVESGNEYGSTLWFLYDSNATGSTISVDNETQLWKQYTIKTDNVITTSSFDYLGTPTESSLQTVLLSIDNSLQTISGVTGPQFIQGIQGVTGATGPQGIQGPTGFTVVVDEIERDSLYPIPVDRFQVFNLRTGNIETYKTAFGLWCNQDLFIAIEDSTVQTLSPERVVFPHGSSVVISGQEYPVMNYPLNNSSRNISDRKSTRLNSSHSQQSRMPSSA